MSSPKKADSLPTAPDLINSERNKKLVRLALFVGLGVVLHRLEALLPLPSPWVKLGLANVVTLIALVVWGMREALTVTILRVFLGSVLGGTFLGPTFLLSFVGGVVGTLVMALVYQKGKERFSLVGVSIAGAYAHTIAIVLCIYFFLSQQGALLSLLPVFLSLSLISGILTGFITNAITRQLGNVSFG